MRCLSIIRCFSLLALFCTGILFIGCHEEIAIDHKDNLRVPGQVVLPITVNTYDALLREFLLL